MDIAVYLTVAVLLAWTGLMTGVALAERGHRRRAQKTTAETLELLAAERDKAQAEIRELVAGINKAHNGFAEEISSMRGKIEALQMRAAMTQQAERSIHGRAVRPTQAPG